VDHYEVICEAAKPDSYYLGQGLTTRRHGLDEFVASPVSISFINRRRLERAKKNPPPKLTTDALSLLVFRNIMLDVAALQGEGGREGGPIPGVEVFGHFTTRMGACRLPRPIYARLSGPALEATAWAGSELWVRLQCFVG